MGEAMKWLPTLFEVAASILFLIGALLGRARGQKELGFEWMFNGMAVYGMAQIIRWIILPWLAP